MHGIVANRSSAYAGLALYLTKWACKAYISSTS